MQLRGKVLGLFLVTFGLVSLVTLTLLHSNLQKRFTDIEQRQATEKAAQLSRTLNSEMAHLNQTVFDWAGSDAVYSAIQQPGRSQADRRGSVLRETDVQFIAVVDHAGNTVFSEAVNLPNGVTQSVSNFDNTISNLKKRIAQSSASGADRVCGLDISGAGPMLLCWQPVRKNGQNAGLGTVVMAKLLNGDLIGRISQQANVRFELSALPVQDTPPSVVKRNSADLEKIEFSATEAGVLNALLLNFNGQPILKVRLLYPTEISKSGSELTWKMLELLALSMALTGLIVFVGVQRLIIRRLQKMGHELSSIWRNGRWAERLGNGNVADEIGEVTRTVNRMLGLIRKQSMVLETMAHTDALTKIANRRAFDQRILIEMSLHKRNQTALSLLLIDVDHIIEYNDHYGQQAGDEILIEIGKLLTLVACRPSDMPARIAEVEFAVILPATDLAGAHHVAEMLKSKLARLNLAHGNSPIGDKVTLSIGVVCAADEDLSGFMHRAGKALLSAREKGRNNISSLSGSAT